MFLAGFADIDAPDVRNTASEPYRDSVFSDASSLDRDRKLRFEFHYLVNPVYGLCGALSSMTRVLD